MVFPKIVQMMFYHGLGNFELHFIYKNRMHILFYRTSNDGSILNTKYPFGMIFTTNTKY
jgi:hypothetical protein